MYEDFIFKSPIVGKKAETTSHLNKMDIVWSSPTKVLSLVDPVVENGSFDLDSARKSALSKQNRLELERWRKQRRLVEAAESGLDSCCAQNAKVDSESAPAIKPRDINKLPRRSLGPMDFQQHKKKSRMSISLDVHQKQDLGLAKATDGLADIKAEEDLGATHISEGSQNNHHTVEQEQRTVEDLSSKPVENCAPSHGEYDVHLLLLANDTLYYEQKQNLKKLKMLKQQKEQLQRLLHSQEHKYQELLQKMRQAMDTELTSSYSRIAELTQSLAKANERISTLESTSQEPDLV